MGAREGNPRRQYGCLHAGVFPRLTTERAIPPELDPKVSRREIAIEAVAETLAKMRKECPDSVCPISPVSPTGALILALGFNLLDVTLIRVANFLPALVIAPSLVALSQLSGP